MVKKENNLNKGFTLFEILIALALITVIIGMVIGSFVNDSNNMNKALGNIKRSIRFGVGESTIRNVIVRVQFELDKDPQEITVEYGPDDTFVLPPQNTNFMGERPDGIREGEEFDERTKKVNQSFNKLKEFSDNAIEIPPNITILGIGTNLSLKLVTNFFASVYIYPSGEKDSAIIILSSQTQVIGLIVSPFSEDFYEIIKDVKLINENEDIEEAKFRYAKEIYEEWLKN